MSYEALRAFCAGLPHATETVQWGGHDVFKVGGKIFAILGRDLDTDYRISLKCEPGAFDELCAEPGVRPAPHLARYGWVQIESGSALTSARVVGLVTSSHTLVLGALSRASRAALVEGAARPAGASKRSAKPAAPKRAADHERPRRPSKGAASRPRPASGGNAIAEKSTPRARPGKGSADVATPAARRAERGPGVALAAKERPPRGGRTGRSRAGG